MSAQASPSRPRIERARDMVSSEAPMTTVQYATFPNSGPCRAAFSGPTSASRATAQHRSATRMARTGFPPFISDEIGRPRVVLRRLGAREIGALHVGHRLDVLRQRGAALHLLRRELLDPGLKPVNVAQRVAHAADAIAEGERGRLGHGCRSGLDGATEGGVGVVDVEPQEGRQPRPLGLGVEGHDDRVADAGLGVPDRAVGVLDAGELLGAEGSTEEREQPRGVVADDPRGDGGVADGDGHGRWCIRALGPYRSYVSAMMWSVSTTSARLLQLL